jgi:hypothetical protein
MHHLSDAQIQPPEFTAQLEPSGLQLVHRSQFDFPYVFIVLVSEVSPRRLAGCILCIARTREKVCPALRGDQSIVRPGSEGADVEEALQSDTAFTKAIISIRRCTR